LPDANLHGYIEARLLLSAYYEFRSSRNWDW
jgi:hypothetical protein